MSERYKSTKVRTFSTGTLGRAISNARHHYYVADDSGGEAVNAGEYFLSGITACAVNLVQRLANEDQIPLQWMEVNIEAIQDSQAPPKELTTYDEVRVSFEMWGVGPEDAKALVDGWKQK